MVVNQEEKWAKLRILDFLNPNAVLTELTATTKKGVLEELGRRSWPRMAK